MQGEGSSISVWELCVLGPGLLLLALLQQPGRSSSHREPAVMADDRAVFQVI